MAGIFDQFMASDMKTFEKDFKVLVQSVVHLDNEAAQMRQAYRYNLPRFNECLELFSKKYKDIVLKLEEKSDRTIKLSITFPEEKLPTIYNNVLSKLQGVAELGFDSLDMVLLNNAAKVVSKLDSAKQLCVRYYTEDAKKSTVIIKLNKDKKPELIYDPETVIDTRYPEYKLCLYYGMLHGFKKDIDIQSKAAGFSFESHTSGRIVEPRRF